MTLSVIATPAALRGQVGESLRQACTLADAEVQPFEVGMLPARGSVLVDVLERGERAVPGPLQAALAGGDSGLVLLAGETLSQPLVPLHDGRLQVLAAAASPATIAHGLRSTAAQLGQPSQATLARDALRVREAWGAGCWAGLAAHVPAPTPSDPAQLTDLTGLADLAIRADGLSLMLGGGTAPASAHLSLPQAVWRFLGLEMVGAAWLLSARRLPPQWDLRQTAALARRTLPAGRGDVVLLASFLLSTAEVTAIGAAIRQHGSPHALRELSGLVAKQPEGARALLAEAI